MRASYTYIGADKSNSSVLNRSKLLIEFDVSESIGIGLNTKDIRQEIIQEVDMYFSTKPSMTIEAGLRDFRNIRRVFLKFNCVRSSEAICEHMFSYGGRYFIFLLFMLLSKLQMWFVFYVCLFLHCVLYLVLVIRILLFMLYLSVYVDSFIGVVFLFVLVLFVTDRLIWHLSVKTA